MWSLFSFFSPAQAAISVQDSGAPHIARGATYSHAIVSAAGGSAPYTFSLNSGSSPLPAGLTLASDGTLAGTTCSGAGNYNVTILATDSVNATATGSVGLTVDSGASGACSLSINLTSLQQGTQGQYYSQTLNASGGTWPYSYALSSGALPPGLSLNTGNGALSGTPTAAGTYNFSVRFSDSGTPAKNGVQSYALNIISSLALNSQPSHDQRVATAYAQTNTATGGTGSYSFTLSAGTLPPGLSLDSESGTVSGTPTSVGSYSYAIRVNDGLAAVTNTVSGSISAPTLNMMPNNFSNPQQGSPYSASITMLGGTAPYSFAVSAGVLPTGITLNAATGVFSGIPTAPGTYNFTFRATDSTTGSGAPYSFSRAYNVTVVAHSLSLSSTASAVTRIGAAYAQANTASGGTGSYNFTVSAGTLPSGLSLNTATGAVSGTPSQAGAFNYTIRVSDGVSTASQVITGTIGAPSLLLNPASLPSAKVDSVFSQSFTVSGGTAPYTIAVSAGALPPGLNLNGQTLSGTPDIAGTYTFTLQATDSSTGTGAPFTMTRSYTLTVATPDLVLASDASTYTAIGRPYAQANTASGGSGAYTYSLSAGGLPAGLGLNTATGTVSGTPTQAGAFNYTVQVSDGTDLATHIISGTIQPPGMAIGPTTLPPLKAGTAFSQTLTVSGGTAPYSFSVPALPAGLVLNSATGTITGTPGAAGAYTFTIQATDSSTGTGAPFSQTRTYSGTIAPPDLVLTSNHPSATQIGIPYAQTNTASGGAGSYAYAISAGTLPAGLSLNTVTGTVSGTPTQAGAFSYTVQVSDGTAAATQLVSGTIQPPGMVIGPTTMPPLKTGTTFSQTLTASGGTAPYGFTVTAGVLPSGLSLNGATGAIAGTPGATGAYTFTIQAADSSTGTGAPFSQTRAYSGTVTPPDLVLASGHPGETQIGAPYSQTNTASGGEGSYAYALSSGILPAGLNLNATTGTVSGTPTEAGTFSYTVQVSDGAETAAHTISGTIAPPAISIVRIRLGNPQLGADYTSTLVASGGTAPYAYAIAGGALPAGLSLDGTTGIVTGTPLAPGPYSVDIRATDSSTGAGAPFAQTQTFTGTADNAVLTLAAAASAQTKVGGPYLQTNTGAGGSGTYIYTVSAGALPAGLSLDADTGTVSGTPTQTGAFSYAIQVSDDTTTATQVVSGTISPPAISIVRVRQNGPKVGTAYTSTLVASGGTAPYAYAIAGGALPAGLSLDGTTGIVTGTPLAPGPYSVDIRTTDSSTGASAPFSQTQTFTGTVDNADLTIASDASAQVRIGSTYLQSNAASGGSGAYSYAVSAGALPAGLSLDAATGAVSGTPTQAGAFSYTIQVSDGAVTAAETVSGTIGPPAIVVNPITLPQGTVDISYSQTLTASGGTAPYSFTVTAGALPDGLSLSAGGDISGTPRMAGTYHFTAQAADGSSGTGAPFAGSNSYTISIGNPALHLTATAANPAMIGAPYAQLSTASGGTGFYTYAISSGALPAGLSLDATNGTVSGTPTQAGAFSYMIQVSDGSETAAQTVSGTIAPPALGIVRIRLHNPQLDAVYTSTLVASGGTTPYTYAIVGGALPTGLALNSATGIVTGMPVTPGPYSVNIRATDSSTGAGAPFAQTQTFTGTVGNADLTLTSDAPAQTKAGSAYLQTNTASGGSGTYSYTVSAGALPAGLSLDATSGTVSGTPTQTGAFSYTIQVSDGSETAAQTIAGTISAPAISLTPATLPPGARGTPYNQSLSASGGIAPYSFAVTGGALPAGLSLNSATGAITGTPGAAATYNFTITATDALTFTDARTYTVVIEAALSAQDFSVSIPYASQGEAIDFLPYIAGGATDVMVVSMPAHGTVTTSGTRATYTPARGYSGADSFTYVAVSGVTLSAAARVHIAIGERPDPALDPDVRGIIADQVAATQRFTAAQISNIGDRLQVLHSGTGPVQNNLRVNLAGGCGSGRRDDVGLPDDCAAQTAGLADMQRALNAWLTGGPDEKGPSLLATQGISVWTGGSLDVGRERDGYKGTFSSAGTTIGADKRISSNLTMGISGGIGFDDATIGDNNSRVKKRSLSAAIYGSYEPYPAFFIDGIAGYASSSFRTRRYIAADDLFVTGNRSGDAFFGSLALTAELERNKWRLSPYARLDLLHARLAPYTEQGSDIWALRYEGLTVNSLTASTGLRASYDIPRSWGMLSPMFKLEYSRSMNGSGRQTFGYADLTDGRLYGIDPVNASSGTITGVIGLMGRTRLNQTYSVEYGLTRNGPAQGQGIKFSIHIPF